MNNDIIHILNPLTGAAYCGHPKGLFTEDAEEATCAVCHDCFDGGDLAKLASHPVLTPKPQEAPS